MTAAAMLVVAAGLLDGDGRVLVARRASGKAHAGLWEFPGGKVEPGETVTAALARELAEELGIAIDLAAATPIGFATREREGGDMVLLLFSVDRWEGVPTLHEHQAIAWHPASALVDVAMPPADRALLPALRRYRETSVEVEARAGIEPACKDLQSSA